MKLYRDVLKSAWGHSVQRPGLWIFGFFATFVFGASGELDRYLRLMNSVVTDGHLLNPKSWLDGRWASLAASTYTQLQAGNVNVWVLTILAVLAGLLVLVMMSISVGALIHSAEHHTESFTEAFAAGYKHWMQLILLFVCANLVVIVGSLSMVTVVLKVFTAYTFESAQLATSLVAGIIFVPLVIVVSFLARLASMAIVLDNQHMGQAIKTAWRLFLQHWLVVLEMSIVSFVVVGFVNLFILIGLTVIFLPFFVSMTFNASVDTTVGQIEAILIFGQWVYLLVSLFTAAILSTWQWSAWAQLFQTLRTGQPRSTVLAMIRGGQPKA